GVEIAQRHEGAHHARKAVAVAKPDALQPQRGGAGDELLGVRTTAQEREIAGGDELDITRRLGRGGRAARARGEGEDRAHAKNPCRNQLGAAASSNNPSRNTQKRRPLSSSAT